ncbi:prolipoprotein diacylglyceryl transferase [Corynebacterium sp. zg254]|uniref:Phosphatidylglycerol--prolipoprotein diacylglyceryl transferase n=1 Tax=Corynebacterium zhongnanshanii TaxID=2768834 RepID=A0ABQ6VCZ6_9CORY|nr:MULTISPECIES: prolipoprotein diacylglyceryl transferase [Corynebacterium]KAB3520774.1 prolipoprotein diacylglyceryl transferase [Corynebacterium zhongnanshanii]MCR5914391.1 prolipoprotein diacylglyceryl transferase [Corynebacterium sp. zg254]
MTTTVLAAIPSPPQGVWHLGGFPLRAYALCILTGVVVAYLWTKKRYQERGGDPDVVMDALLVGLPAGIIGARAYHVLTDHQKYFGEGRNPADIFKITNGGLGIWGGIIVGSLAVYALLKVKKVSVPMFAGAVAPALPVAQAIGRLGNWFNQEIYGGPSDKPWALEIYRRVDENGYTDQLAGRSTGEVIASVQPTFLYELLFCLALAAFLVWAEKRFSLEGHRLFMLYVAGYTLGRFFIELLRTDEATLVFGSIRINSVVSAVIFLSAVALLVWTGRKQPRVAASPQRE